MVAFAASGGRKLLMICYGLLKHQEPFNPEWTSQSSGSHLQSKNFPPLSQAEGF
jgi:hypothetical protein